MQKITSFVSYSNKAKKAAAFYSSHHLAGSTEPTIDSIANVCKPDGISGHRSSALAGSCLSVTDKLQPSGSRLIHSRSAMSHSTHLVITRDTKERFGALARRKASTLLRRLVDA